MRFPPHMRNYQWLVERPIAHRGLHDEVRGVVENCESAFAAAIAHGFAIECDIELTKDGEAVVFHDDEVDRLLDARGAVKNFTSAELKQMHYRQGGDRIQTLAELCEQVRGRAALVIEIKSLWDDDFTLTDRAIEVLSKYNGQFALMSFDPALIAHLADIAPHMARGITADQVIDPYYDPLPLEKRLAMKTFSHLPLTRPNFISFDFSQLPYQPITDFRAGGYPVITWTIRNEEQAKQARLYCDQITFEKFIPA